MAVSYAKLLADGATHGPERGIRPRQAQRSTASASSRKATSMMPDSLASAFAGVGRALFMGEAAPHLASFGAISSTLPRPRA